MKTGKNPNPKVITSGSSMLGDFPMVAGPFDLSIDD
jgi:hypothetical protein